MPSITAAGLIMIRKVVEYGIALAICGVLGLTLLVYENGLSGPFIMDDFHNLKPIASLGGIDNFNTFRHFVFGNGSGPSGRPVSMASFLLNDQYWPSSPYGFKLTNLLLHILNGLLIFLLAGKLSERLSGSYTKARLIALITCSLWLLHPLNVSTTLYVVQRMTQLAALFTLLGLWLYTTGRGRIQDSPKVALLLMTASIFPVGALATLSKENGALIFLFIGIIEFTVFRQAARPSLMRWWFRLCVVAPLLLMAGYFIMNWDWIVNGYAARDFSLTERLLTESRIVTDYLGMILAPRTWGMGVINDDIPISTRLLSPISTLPSLLFLGSLLVTGIGLCKKAPAASFGILWFFAGHLIESTFIPLELYFEHRNYLPMIGPLFVIAYYLVIGIGYMSDAFGKAALATVPAFLIGLYTFQTAQATTIWGAPELLYGTWEIEHRDSLRAKRVLAEYFTVASQPAEALKVLKMAEEKHPHDLALPVQMLRVSCQYDLPYVYDIKTIKTKIPQTKITDGLLTNLEALAELVTQGKCYDITPKEFSSLLSRIESMPDFGDRSKITTRILWLHAEIETERGQLNSTVQLLEKAFNYQPTVPVALRRAVILASAGLYKESLMVLDEAESVDGDRPFLTPSRMPELQRVRKAIKREMEATEKVLPSEETG